MTVIQLLRQPNLKTRRTEHAESGLLKEACTFEESAIIALAVFSNPSQKERSQMNAIRFAGITILIAAAFLQTPTSGVAGRIRLPKPRRTSNPRSRRYWKQSSRRMTSLRWRSKHLDEWVAATPATIPAKRVPYIGA